jgi:hypothetical protein
VKPTSRRKKIATVIVSFCAIVGLAGCVSSNKAPSAGPVTLTHHGGICLPMPLYQHVAFGTQLDVGRRGPITIISVTPMGATNVKVLSEHIMKSDEGNRLFAAVWPLDAVYGAPWKAAVPAKYAIIGKKTSVDVVTEVEPVDPLKQVHIRSIRVKYRTADGTQYQDDSDYQFFLSAKKCSDF